MTELFASNLKIIARRWPALATMLTQQTITHLDAKLVNGQDQTISVNDIQLSSRHNRIAEAKLFIAQLPKKANKVTLYGVGMGDVPYLLLEDPHYQHIEICLLNISVFALLLHYTDQSEWLNHPRISLNGSPSQTIQIPYIAITPELTLISDDNALLRDLLVMELNRHFTNQRHKIDDPELLERFKENQYYLKRDPDAQTLLQQYQHQQAIVIGSGPSLEEQYTGLQTLSSHTDRPLIIAADTALRGLMHHGIKPDIVVCIDGLLAEYHLPLAETQDITLVYFPRVAPCVLQGWQGPRFNAYGTSAMYDSLAQIRPKLRLFNGGSVIHPTLDLAVKLNIGTITLLGCDFCYCNNKGHAFWHDHQFNDEQANEKIWVNAVNQKVQNAKHWILNGHGERVATDLNLRAYLRQLEMYIAQHPQTHFYQSSLSGAKIQGAPYKALTTC